MRIIYLFLFLFFILMQSCDNSFGTGRSPNDKIAQSSEDTEFNKNQACLRNIGADLRMGKSLKRDSAKLLDAVIYFNKINDKKNELQGLVFLGIVYEQYAEYQSSLICFREALELSEKLGDKRQLAYLHSKIGVIYLLEYDLISSAGHLKISSELFRQLTSGETDMNHLLQAALTYLYTSDTENSLRLFEYLYTFMNRTDERYPVLLRNMAIAYLYEEKWDQALSCLASIPSGKEPEKVAIDKLIAMYIYMHTGQKEELNSTRIELEELMPQISNLNIQQSFYQIDSDYHMHAGDLKNALMQLKRSLIYKDRIQAHLSKGTPDELYATYQIDKLKTKYSRLEHSIILFVSIFFIAALLLCSFYFWYRRKKRLYIFELESKLEALESIVEKDRRASSAIAHTIIRDLEITKRIALLKNQQINTNQTFVEKLNKVLTIDDKNPFTIEWPRFYDDVDKLYNGFYKFLCDSYTGLSEKELQLCCLMRVGFKTDEIAAVWAQSVYSVQKCRSSVRKKMQTGEGADIILFIEDKMKTS